MATGSCSTGRRSRPSGSGRPCARPAPATAPPRRRTSWSPAPGPAAATTRGAAPSPRACRSRSTSGPGTRRADAGPTRPAPSSSARSPPRSPAWPRSRARALEAARALARPGAAGRALYDAAAQVVEEAGFPTLRTRPPGASLTQGFYFSLGHGVGLEVHEAPLLGLASDHELVAGDVIAIEPGIEGLDGIGGVRYEDLLLVTDDGCETLTDFPYDLAP